ncbi:MAG: polysaccharide deacetylase family protein [Actinomycetota bacterium]|nr:polysaccharide deacetylase family protein [Actinomycetota bacterium]
MAVAAVALLVAFGVEVDHPLAKLQDARPAAAGPLQPVTPATSIPRDPGGGDASGTLPPSDPSPVTAAVPGVSHIIAKGPATSANLALTFDDGDCEQCVAGIVDGVERTGVHVTFCPNGAYGPATWDKYADRIRALIAKNQVAICNHTWDHKDLTKVSDQQIRTELTRNEQWIEQTFGVSAFPVFRPPYGAHNRRVDRVAADLGFTQVLMWSGTLGDSIIHPPDFILSQMQMYAKPGMVILAHGNHPATASVFDQLVGIAHQSGLQLLTVPELLKPP